MANYENEHELQMAEFQAMDIADWKCREVEREYQKAETLASIIGTHACLIPRRSMYAPSRSKRALRRSGTPSRRCARNFTWNWFLAAARIVLPGGRGGPPMSQRGCSVDGCEKPILVLAACVGCTTAGSGY